MKVAVIILVGLAMLGFIVMRLGCSKRDEGTSESKFRVPVDLNKPVENPELVAALDAYMRNPSSEGPSALATQLNKGIYLLPVVTDQAQITRSETDPGKAVFEKDTLISVLLASDADGNALVPLFTDWTCIRSWTTQDVATFVVGAQEAWAFATMGETYSGAVINPGTHNLQLKRPELEQLKAK